MGRFGRFIGDIEVEVAGETLNFGKIEVKEKGKFISVLNTKDYEKVYSFMQEFMYKHFPNEPKEEIDAFLLKYSEDLMIQLMSVLNFMSEEQADKQVDKLEQGRKQGFQTPEQTSP